MPVSSRGYRYRGINVFILAATSMANGYRSPVWLTFKQINELGGKVNEGEKSTLVTYWKLLEIEERDANTNELKKKKIPLLRFYLVFNLDQTTGVKLSKAVQKIQDAATDEGTYKGGVREEDAIEAAEAIVKGYENGPLVRFGSNRAAYSPTLDVIGMPDKTDFDKIEEFYATEFHEFGHSTGHSSRLNRAGITSFDHFGSGQYADEELIAELTAAMLCAEAGIDNTIENSAAYIASWKAKLTADPKLIVQAAGKAQKAVDYITGKQFEGVDA